VRPDRPSSREMVLKIGLWYAFLTPRPEGLEVTTFFRTLLGTIVYTIIIVLAAPFPSAAGLFLTFPALNGLGFFFSPPSSVEPMAKSMLWMPVINGALCAAYIVVFLAFSQIVAPTILVWVSVIAVAGLWFAIASRKIVRDGIAREHQLIYGTIVLLVGCALVGLAPRALGGPAIAPGSGLSTHFMVSLDFLLQTLWQSRLKIGLFATCLF
jgi:hypothetical protein